MLISPAARGGATLDARVLLGSDNPAERGPSAARCRATTASNASAAGSPAWPRPTSPGTVTWSRAVTAKLGYDADELEAWRLRLSFPVHQSVAEIRLVPAEGVPPRRRRAATAPDRG